MKKLMFTIALVAFAFAANAQFVLGGEISYNTIGGGFHHNNSGGVGDKDWKMPVDHENNLTIMPKIGYNLNDQMQVGVSFGIIRNQIRTFSNTINYSLYDNYESYTDNARLNFTIAPYFRYNVFQTGKLTWFAEAQFGVVLGGRGTTTVYESAYTDVSGVDHKEINTTTDGLSKTNVIYLTITPGVNYKFNDRFSADLYIDLLSLGYTHSHQYDYATNSSSKEYVSAETMTNNFGLNCKMTAQSLIADGTINPATMNISAAGILSSLRLGFNYHF